MSKPMPHACGYFRSDYRQEFKIIETRAQFRSAGLFILLMAVFPFLASPFELDLACQIFLATVGSLSLMLLTGYAGQVSLGHAGLLAAGAYTVGILAREIGAGFWLTIPLSAVVGAVLGVIFGLPSLRLRGLYLAVSTLALYFVIAYLGAEYETHRGFSTGIMVDPPAIAGYELTNPIAWYFVLLAAAVATWFVIANLLRGHIGRAWQAVRGKETVAEALGIDCARYKLLAFVVSSSITAVAGALFAYYRGFVSIEAFSLFLSIQYIAMILIGGNGSLGGAVIGAIVVTLLPYTIEAGVQRIPGADAYAGAMFAINYASFGAMMILFLLFEPQGLIGIWRRFQAYLLFWPFKGPLFPGGR